jgi:flagellar biogenesis protein FliO
VVPVVYESPLPSAGRAAAAGESPPAEKATAAMPRSPHDRESPLALSSPGGTHRAETGKPAAGLPPAITVVGSLAVVLGIFLLFAWGLRRAAPRSLTVLPGEVLEILGRAPLAGRQQLHLLRCGNKLLLVSVTPAGAETLTEITDPAEVDRLAGLCQQARPNSATAAFRQVFQQFNRQHSSSGFAGQQGHGYDDCRLANAGVGSEGLEDRHG